MRQFKIIAAAVLAFALAIVIVQNSEPVETRVLFFAFTLPQAVLLFATGAAGFVLGILVALLWRKGRTG